MSVLTVSGPRLSPSQLPPGYYQVSAAELLMRGMAAAAARRPAARNVRWSILASFVSTQTKRSMFLHVALKLTVGYVCKPGTIFMDERSDLPCGRSRYGNQIEGRSWCVWKTIGNMFDATCYRKGRCF